MLIYCFKDDLGNFGDDLNFWLWPRLLPQSRIGFAYHGIEYRQQNEELAEVFVGIGTLLDERLPRRPRKIICGAGAGYGARPAIDGTWEVIWVRGPMTAKLLGLAADQWITDPAMMLARWPLGDARTGAAVGYMPHHRGAKPGLWDDVCADAGLRYIDPHAGVEDTLAEIRGLDVLLTEAMHGAIVADALRVPWVAVSTHSGINAFKWQDWCASIGIDYRPESLPALWHASEDAAAARLRLGIKKRLARRAIARLAQRCRPQLSTNARLDEALDRLEQATEAIRSRQSGTVS